MSELENKNQDFQPQNSGKAIASMVCSIVGFFICFLVGQIVGIVLGYGAKKEIKESKGKLTGEGFANAGIIVGWIGIALDLLIILFVVGIMFMGISLPFLF